MERGSSQQCSSCLCKTETVHTYQKWTQQVSQVSDRVLDLFLSQADLGIDSAHGDPAVPFEEGQRKGSGSEAPGNEAEPHISLCFSLCSTQLPSSKRRQ